MKYIIIIFIITIFFFYYINIFLKKYHIENFCKIPKIDEQGGINDKKVLLDYPPQSDILTSSCDQYWKDWPKEYNNTMVENNPIVIKSDQLELPKEKQFGNNDYKAGLLNFKELASLINDKNDNNNIFNISSELLIDPLKGIKLEYKYELEYAYIELNKKTWINRWENYNPSIKNKFNYDEIKSPIDNINKLNLEFQNRCNIRQKKLLTNKQLILFGLLNFDIFKYKILNINYLNDDLNKPIYVIEIMLYRETDLYVNTFSYVGYINNNIPILINVKYIGRNSTDNILLSDFYNPNEIKNEIINNNFSNAPLINKDPDAILELTKKHQESYKLKNQYACFNLNYDPKLKNNYILPYYSRETCESMFDPYGKYKDIGIYDKPCNEDKDCPFYKINKNYENNYGKCQEDGYCELPINMERIGYRYFRNKDTEKPLCYNCNSKEFKVSTILGDCCKEQYDKEKYPFLKTPDIAFVNDFLDRKNFFNNKFCKSKPDSFDINCQNITI